MNPLRVTDLKLFAGFAVVERKAREIGHSTFKIQRGNSESRTIQLTLQGSTAESLPERRIGLIKAH